MAGCHQSLCVQKGHRHASLGRPTGPTQSELVRNTASCLPGLSDDLHPVGVQTSQVSLHELHHHTLETKPLCGNTWKVNQERQPLWSGSHLRRPQGTPGDDLKESTQRCSSMERASAHVSGSLCGALPNAWGKRKPRPKRIL